MTKEKLRKILDKMTRIAITGCVTLRECSSINELNLVHTNFCGKIEMIFEMGYILFDSMSEQMVIDEKVTECKERLYATYDECFYKLLDE